MSTIFKKLSDSDRNINASLYFGNIDPEIDELLMYELFIQFGLVKSLNMPKDKILKTHQGYGFVEFHNMKDAIYTMDILKGVRLYNKPLKLKKIDNKSTLQSVQQAQAMPFSNESKGELLSSKYIDVGARVFVNNLNPLIDSKFLLDTFNKFGKVIRMPQIKYDKEGKSQGFGFVDFQDFEMSDKAIEKLNNSILMNKKVQVSYAFKSNGKRHGDAIERKLASKKRKL
ncbi:unnamed protein product [Candida verbasci]|uniref:RRM domain-containing protein n=1 Tax=Candida verbasci TaxID=1227364 RepID=A0A9W4TUU2_9ASCO|nr:unnamed protein product [Candida verbasci]